MTNSTANKMTAETLNAHLAAGGVVQVTTYMRSWILDSRHVGFFRQSATGSLSMRSGRSWSCVDGAAIRCGRYE